MSVSQAQATPIEPGHDGKPVHDGLWSPGRRSLTVGLVLTITLVAFEALAVSTVMPIVARELNGIELYGWVFTAFMLGSLIGIVLVGGLIDRRGLGGPFAAGIALFAIGLIVGGLAPSMPVLVAARFVQGLGAGTVPPIAYVAIGRSLPEHLRPQMFATLSTAWVLPGVLGPALAGIVGETIGWRWVFLGLLPLIVVSASIAFPAVRKVGPDPSDARTPPRSANVPRSPSSSPSGPACCSPGLTSGQTLPLVVLGVIGLLIGLFALRRLTPAGTLRAARGLPAAVLMRGHHHVRLLRGRRLRRAGPRRVARPQRGRGGHRPDRGDGQLDGRLLDAGPVLEALAARAVRPGRAPGPGRRDSRASASSWSRPSRRGSRSPRSRIAGYAMGLAYSPLALIVLREAPSAEQGRASSAISLTDSLGTALGTGITGALVAASVRSTGDAGDGAGARVRRRRGGRPAGRRARRPAAWRSGRGARRRTWWWRPAPRESPARRLPVRDTGPAGSLR